MKKRKYHDKLFIDMPFDKALERFAGVDPKEMHANIAKEKGKKKPPTGKKPASGPVESQNVVRLRDRWKSHNVR